MQVASTAPGSAREADDSARRWPKRAPERIEELRHRLRAGWRSGASPAVARTSTQDPRVRQLRLPRVARDQLRLPGLRQRLAEVLLPGRVHRRVAAHQPMGFYSPATLLSDARRHGVTVTGVDVNASAALATLQLTPVPTDYAWLPPGHSAPPGRLSGWGGAAAVPPRPPPAAYQSRPAGDQVGLSSVRNLGDDPRRRHRGRPAVRGPGGLRPPHVAAGPGDGSAGHRGRIRLLRAGRREALWAAGAAAAIRPGQLPGTTPGLDAPALPPMTAAEETFADLWATGRAARTRSRTSGTCCPPAACCHVGDGRGGGRGRGRGRRAGDAPAAAGHRRRGGVPQPGGRDRDGQRHLPAGGVARYRRIGVDASALLVHGRVESLDGAVSLVATRLERLRVVAAARSRDFR